MMAWFFVDRLMGLCHGTVGVLWGNLLLIMSFELMTWYREVEVHGSIVGGIVTRDSDW